MANILRITKGIGLFDRSVLLQWSNPAFNDDDEIMIRRKLTEFPLDETDGDELYRVNASSSIVEYTDTYDVVTNPLLHTEVYYYKLFYGEHTQIADPELEDWYSSIYSEVSVVTQDTETLRTLLFDKMPKIYKRLDTSHDLANFLIIFGAIMNYIYTHINMFKKNQDISICDSKILPYFAKDIKCLDIPEMSTNVRRFAVYQSIPLYKVKGTDISVTKIAEIYTGWESFL